MKELDLKNFDTQNVTNMSWMFSNSRGLTKINLNSFDTKNVTDMSVMFNDCKGITDINLSNFDTKKVTNMESMFNNCTKLTNLDISNFDTSNVTKMGAMFYFDTNLTELDLSNFKTDKVTSMTSMFGGCDNLTSLNLSNFNTSSVTDTSYMFYSCTNLKVVYGRKDRWITTKVTNSSNMWEKCGTNYITYKTYLEGNKVVGYGINRGFNWYANSMGDVAKKGSNAKRGYTIHYIQLDSEKTYKLKMNNVNYYASYLPVDIDYKRIGNFTQTNATNTELTITGYEYIVVTFGPIPADQNLTDEMLAEIEEAFSITVVE